MASVVNSSTGLRVLILDAIKAAMDGGQIEIYGGIRPDAADDSLGSAVLLCTVKIDGTDGIIFDDSTAGLLVKPAGDTWTGTNVATGTATFFRLVLDADTGAASTSAPRLQGSVGVVGADLNLDTVSLVSGLPTPITSFNIGIYAQLP